MTCGTIVMDLIIGRVGGVAGGGMTGGTVGCHRDLGSMGDAGQMILIKDTVTIVTEVVACIANCRTNQSAVGRMAC